MTPTHEIRVTLRTLRWEVSVDGVTRPLVDWFYSKERALEHARALAHELDDGPSRIVVERSDGEVERMTAA